MHICSVSKPPTPASLGSNRLIAAAPTRAIGPRVGAAGDDAASRQGDGLVPAVILDDGEAWTGLAISGELADMRVVVEDKGFDVARHGLPRHLIGDPAAARTPRLSEISNRAARGRVNRPVPQDCTGIRLAVAGLDKEVVRWPPGQAGQAIAPWASVAASTPGAQIRLCSSKTMPWSLIPPRGSPLSLSRIVPSIIRVGRPEFEPTWVVHRPFGFHRSHGMGSGYGDRGPVAIHQVELNGGDRWLAETRISAIRSRPIPAMWNGPSAPVAAVIVIRVVVGNAPRPCQGPVCAAILGLCYPIREFALRGKPQAPDIDAGPGHRPPLQIHDPALDWRHLPPPAPRS